MFAAGVAPGRRTGSESLRNGEPELPGARPPLTPEILYLDLPLGPHDPKNMLSSTDAIALAGGTDAYRADAESGETG